MIDTAFGKLRAEVESCTVGAKVTVAVRPENIAKGEEAGENCVSGEVISSSYHGPVRRVEIEANGVRLIADIPVKRCLSKVGDRLSLSWPADDTRLLPGQGHAAPDGKNLQDMLQ